MSTYHRLRSGGRLTPHQVNRLKDLASGPSPCGIYTAQPDGVLRRHGFLYFEDGRQLGRIAGDRYAVITETGRELVAEIEQTTKQAAAEAAKQADLAPANAEQSTPQMSLWGAE